MRLKRCHDKSLQIKVIYGNLPNLCAKDSTYQADPMPTRSEMVLPRAAAAMVEMPSFMPRESSMYSPAMIITKLSRKPNPTKGREL